MATIKVIESNRDVIKAMKEMVDGEFGVIVEPNYYEGAVVCKKYKTVMSLTDGRTTWDSTDCTNKVRIFPKGTKIEITC